MTGGDRATAAAAAAWMENRSKGPKLRRPNDPPARYGPLEEEFTVEINHGGFFCGFGNVKSYVNGKQARFDGCEADTWSPLWLYDFMEQLGYPDRDKYSLYWLLPGQDLGSGLRIVDRDIDIMHMISVVPKFQYFQMFVDHKDMNFADDIVIDDVLISGSPSLPPVLSPTCGSKAADAATSGSFPARQQQHSNGHELRRSRRKLNVEEEAKEAHNCSGDDSDSELDDDWVDSDNELAADDDDLFEEWVDEDFEAAKKKKSKWRRERREVGKRT